jgi:hypothetical protein
VPRRARVIIAKAGKAKARLVQLADCALREPGGWEGKVWIADDFEPLPLEIVESAARLLRPIGG